MQTAELERPPRVAHDWGLATLDRAADRGVKVPLRESVVTGEDIAATDDILVRRRLRWKRR